MRAFMPEYIKPLNFGGISSYYFNSNLKTGTSSDVFVKSPVRDEIYFESPMQLKEYTPVLDKIRTRFDKDKYFMLSDELKDDLYSDIPLSTKLFAGENIIMAKVFKNALDEKFGEGKYKFVSLGTSPSCIAKAMELSGEDVVYLPMSFSKKSCAKSWLNNSPYIENYRDYMKQKGLTNDVLESQGKVAVLCDYTNSGRSLELSEYMLQGSLGLDKKNIRTVTMNEIIQNSDDITKEWKEKYMSEFLFSEQMEKYSEVPHFDFLDSDSSDSEFFSVYENMRNYFDNHTGLNSNSHNFCLMYILSQSGRLKTDK